METEPIVINGLETALSKLRVIPGDVLLFHSSRAPTPAAIDHLRQRCIEVLGFAPLILIVPTEGGIEHLDAETAATLITMLQQNNLLHRKPQDPVQA